MKVVKLDRRFAGFPNWKYACQFPLKNHQYRKEYFSYAHAFRDMYGPDYWSNPDYQGPLANVPAWLYNEHWRADYKRQRILVKDQALITMIQLKITG